MQNKTNIFSYIAFISLAFVFVLPLNTNAAELPPFIPEVKENVPEVKETTSNTSGDTTPAPTPTVKETTGSNTSAGNEPTAFVPDVKGSGSDNTSAAGGSTSFVPTVKENSSNTSADPVTPVVETPTTPSSRSGSRSGGRSGGSSVSTVTTSVVTSGSATTPSVCPYINTFILPGANNNTDDVTRLKVFLNTSEGASLTVNGIYDEATQNAVALFQTKYANDILAPWNRTIASKNVYLTTKKKINEIVCGSAFALTAAELAEIAKVRDAILLNNALTIPTTVTPDAVVTETPVEVEIAPVIGSNATNTNVASIATNTGVFNRFFNWIKGMFGSN